MQIVCTYVQNRSRRRPSRRGKNVTGQQMQQPRLDGGPGRKAAARSCQRGQELACAHCRRHTAQERCDKIQTVQPHAPSGMTAATSRAHISPPSVYAQQTYPPPDFGRMRSGLNMWPGDVQGGHPAVASSRHRPGGVWMLGPCQGSTARTLHGLSKTFKYWLGLSLLR